MTLFTCPSTLSSFHYMMYNLQSNNLKYLELIGKLLTFYVSTYKCHYTVQYHVVLDAASANSYSLYTEARTHTKF